MAMNNDVAGGGGGARDPSVPRGGGSGGARGPKAGPKGNPKANPNSNPNSLGSQATTIANAQTTGPITELARQIARNNTQGQSAEHQTFGYFMQLAQQAKDGLAAENANGTALNGTLAGIGSQTQSALQGFGQSAQGGALGAMGALGLDGGGLATVSADAARQQGIGALNAGVFRDHGATQGANYSGLAASNLGTYALRGQERIGDIGRAAQLKNMPLMDKMAALQASKGALKAAALGKLKQQDFTNKVTVAGLGIKQGALNATIQNNQANQSLKQLAIKTTLRGQDLTQMRSDRQFKLDVAKFGFNTAKDNYLKNNGLGPYKPARTGGSGGLGPSAQNSVYNHIDFLTGELQTLTSLGYPAQSAYHILQNGGRVQVGTSAKGLPIYKVYKPNSFGTPVLNAAYNVRSGGGGLTPGDIAWFKSQGLNPSRYKNGGGILSSNPLASISF